MMSQPHKASFHWDDPLLLDAQLSADERAVRDAARAYCQERLSTRVLLQKTMQDDVGALRSETRLAAALGIIGRLTDELGETPPGDGKRFDMRRIDWFDLRNMLLVARVVAEAAFARTETRGAQQREDFPHLSSDWAFNQTVNLGGSHIELSGGPRATAASAP